MGLWLIIKIYNTICTHAHTHIFRHTNVNLRLYFQDIGEIDCKPAAGHYTGAGDELDVEDLYTKYKVL